MNYIIFYPLIHAKTILEIIPKPSFMIHVIAAPREDAVLSPTPTPCKTALVAKVFVIVLQNA